jgi:uncharacterized protein
MATNHAINHPLQQGRVKELTFAGDHVCLAGQVNYPNIEPPANGYPLIFLLPHAGSNTRDDYAHYVEIALASGYAIFLWDKRGTGRSGASGRGSTMRDALSAYKTALEQDAIDPDNVIIFSQCASTQLLGESFAAFAEIQSPYGALLVGNMLDAEAIRTIKTQIFVAYGEEDWNDWQIYARDACESHNTLYDLDAAFYLAPNANRMLMVKQDNEKIFHADASRAILDWLQSL